MKLGREQFRIWARERITLLDGAMGTLLQASGLPAGRPPDELNLSNPDAVRAAHAAYVAAGARIITTNTFGATRPRLAPYHLGARAAEMNRAGVRLAREAAGEAAWVAGDVGPLGEYVEPIRVFNLRRRLPGLPRTSPRPRGRGRGYHRPRDPLGFAGSQSRVAGGAGRFRRPGYRAHDLRAGRPHGDRNAGGGGGGSPDGGRRRRCGRELLVERARPRRRHPRDGGGGGYAPMRPT